MKLKLILKNLMVAQGVTLSELSRNTGVPKQTIHNWLCGTEPKAFGHIRAVAKYFEISIEELCYGPEEKIARKKLFNPIEEHEEEIRAGIFEVVLRKVKREAK